MRFIENSKNERDASRQQDKAGAMAKEYLSRQELIDDKIMKVIKQSRVAFMEITKKNEREKEAAREAARNRKIDPESIDALMGSLQPNEEEEPEQPMGKGFVRSQRSQAMRLRDEMDDQIQEMKNQQAELRQKVEDALAKLKKYNNQKGELSAKLADQMQFVRDLQKASGAAGLEDLDTVASKELTEEFKREKELSSQLNQ